MKDSKFVRNPFIENELLARLRTKYLTKRPEIPHLSELIYCLTRSYDDRFNPIEPTTRELLLFTIGFGLEEMLLRLPGDKVIETKEMDGIFLTPDYITLDNEGVDLKSTRMYPDPNGIPKMGWPDTWLEQFKGYARLVPHSISIGGKNKITYGVAVIYLGTPDLVAGSFIFSPQEIEDNWNNLLTRKKIYMAHVEKQVRPAPFTYNKEWECKNCRYKARCDEVARKQKEVV